MSYPSADEFYAAMNCGPAYEAPAPRTPALIRPDPSGTMRNFLLSPKQRTGALIAIAVALWLAALALGQRWLMSYEAAPGKAGAPLADWPQGTPLRRSTEQATLLVFVHPHCPCTRASLDVLEWALARSAGQVDAWAIFVCPPGAEAGWEQTSSWRRAAAIPGLSCGIDDDGREARRFGAETSGFVVVYDAHGRLVFRGGITAGRGQAGEGAARHALLDCLRGEGPPPTRDWPVFGCPLLDPE